MTIEVRNGCFSYGVERKILDGISFSAQAGDLVAVLGPNGAGKTTLLRCMMGFLRWNDGESLIDGKNIRQIPHRELWKKLAYVPQARNVSAAYSVEETVLMGRNSHFGMLSQPSEKDLAKAHAILEKLKITDIKDKNCSEISGGELQMTLIARALAAEPQILILDEPESNLDFRNQLIVLETMSELAAGGITCIFNTHYPAHALQRANKSLLLSRNGSCICGATSEIVTEENICRTFGVKTVIGEIETPESMLKSIMPIEVSDNSDAVPESTNPRKIAIVSIITDNFGEAEKINGYLHEYNKYLIGRMGMPYRRGGVFIINATLDAPESEIRAFVGKLSVIPSVSVKATYARGEFDEVNYDG